MTALASSRPASGGDDRRHGVAQVAPSGTIRRAAATVLAGLMCAALGCSRTLTKVELEPILFAHEAAPIEGTIELCLDRELRTRQWNVRKQPFRIELGPRTALNVERLAKQAFRRVIVSFDEPCGSATKHPWLSARILAANRDPDSIWSGSQETTVTIELALSADDGTLLWSTTERGIVRKSSTAPLFRRKTRAAEDFGEAIRSALESAFEDLVESGDVRRGVGR